MSEVRYRWVKAKIKKKLGWFRIKEKLKGNDMMNLNQPKKCQSCGLETSHLLTARNYKGEMKWVCPSCYYKW